MRNLMLNRYRNDARMAESEFANMDGGVLDSNFFMDNGVQGSGLNSAFFMDNGANGAAPVGGAMIPLAEAKRTYTVTVSNTTTDDQTVTLFGAYANASASNFGNPTGVTVTIAESSYGEVLEQSKSAPFVVEATRINSSNANQVTQVLTLRKRQTEGVDTSYRIIPANFFGPNQFQSNIIVIPQVFAVYGTDSIQFTILASTTVTLTLNLRAVIDNSNPLRGASVLEATTRPAPILRANAQKVIVDGSAY